MNLCCVRFVLVYVNMSRYMPWKQDQVVVPTFDAEGVIQPRYGNSLGILTISCRISGGSLGKGQKDLGPFKPRKFGRPFRRCQSWWPNIANSFVANGTASLRLASDQLLTRRDFCR